MSKCHNNLEYFYTVICYGVFFFAFLHFVKFFPTVQFLSVPVSQHLSFNDHCLDTKTPLLPST